MRGVYRVPKVYVDSGTHASARPEIASETRFTLLQLRFARADVAAAIGRTIDVDTTFCTSPLPRYLRFNLKSIRGFQSNVEVAAREIAVLPFRP